MSIGISVKKNTTYAVSFAAAFLKYWKSRDSRNRPQ